MYYLSELHKLLLKCSKITRVELLVSLTSPTPGLPFPLSLPSFRAQCSLKLEFYTSHLVKVVASVASVYISCPFALAFVSTSFPGSTAC